jgi:hypothetical protein
MAITLYLEFTDQAKINSFQGMFPRRVSGWRNSTADTIVAFGFAG